MTNVHDNKFDVNKLQIAINSILGDHDIGAILARYLPTPEIYAEIQAAAEREATEQGFTPGDVAYTMRQVYMLARIATQGLCTITETDAITVIPGDKQLSATEERAIRLLIKNRPLPDGLEEIIPDLFHLFISNSRQSPTVREMQTRPLATLSIPDGNEELRRFGGIIASVPGTVTLGGVRTIIEAAAYHGISGDSIDELIYGIADAKRKAQTQSIDQKKSGSVLLAAALADAIREPWQYLDFTNPHARVPLYHFLHHVMRDGKIDDSEAVLLGTFLQTNYRNLPSRLAAGTPTAAREEYLNLFARLNLEREFYEIALREISREFVFNSDVFMPERFEGLRQDVMPGVTKPVNTNTSGEADSTNTYARTRQKFGEQLAEELQGSSWLRGLAPNESEKRQLYLIAVSQFQEAAQDAQAVVEAYLGYKDILPSERERLLTNEGVVLYKTLTSFWRATTPKLSTQLLSAALRSHPEYQRHQEAPQ